MRKQSSTHISPIGLSLIKSFEGFYPKAYLCPAGLQTIGYGHVIRPGEVFAQPLSETQAETLLRQDVFFAEAAVDRLIKVPLTQGQFDALASFTFNCGAGSLQRSTLRACINRQEHERVPEELLKWTRVGGKIVSGLLRRRMAEAALYTT